jgi:hypothetical protein
MISQRKIDILSFFLALMLFTTQMSVSFNYGIILTLEEVFEVFSKDIAISNVRDLLKNHRRDAQLGLCDVDLEFYDQDVAHLLKKICLPLCIFRANGINDESLFFIGVENVLSSAEKLIKFDPSLLLRGKHYAEKTVTRTQTTIIVCPDKIRPPISGKGKACAKPRPPKPQVEEIKIVEKKTVEEWLADIVIAKECDYYIM